MILVLVTKRRAIGSGVKCFGIRFVRPPQQKLSRKYQVGDQALAEKRAVPEDRRQHPGSRWILYSRRRKIGDRIVTSPPAASVQRSK